MSSPVTQFAARGVVGSVVLRFLKPFPLFLVVLLSGLLPFAVTPGREDAAVAVRVAGVVGGATMLPRCVGGEPGPRPRKRCSEDVGRRGHKVGSGGGGGRALSCGEGRRQPGKILYSAQRVS